jgi:ribonuclease HII
MNQERSARESGSVAPGRARVSSRDDRHPPISRQMKQRPFRQAGRTHYAAVIGCDEVGRGALCGPVVVAAVWFDPACFDELELLDDSKRLTPRARERLDGTIRANASVSVVAVSAPLIDRRGIRRATLDAMSRAIRELGVSAPVRVDGLDTPPGLDLDVIPLVQGDRRVPQIAAASIVAKVTRDRILRSLAPRYPDFCWEQNMGYATEAHLDALRRLGPTPHHRRSFAAEAAFQTTLGL